MTQITPYPTKNDARGSRGLMHRRNYRGEGLDSSRTSPTTDENVSERRVRLDHTVVPKVRVAIFLLTHQR